MSRHAFHSTRSAAALLLMLGSPWAAGRSAAQAVAPQPSPTAARAPVLEVADVHSFIPQQSFDGRSLAGWRPLGGQWQAAAGEIVGTVPQGGSGWLLLDPPEQDLAFTAEFRCGAGCRTGILLRGETVGDRTTGVLYSFAPGDMGAYRVTLDAQGKEIERQKLEPPVSPYPPSMMAFRAEFPGVANLTPAELGQQRAIGVLNPEGAWNHVEVYLSGGSVRGLLNGGGIAEGGVDGATPSAYGRLALYVSGTPGAAVRFRSVGIKNLDEKAAQPVEVTSPRFRKLQLESMFFSEAITAADLDRDGNLDVISGPYYFLGPDFQRRRELFVPRVYSATSYPDPLLASASDFTGDGYPDVLYGGEPGRPGVLYVNPGKEVRRWDSYTVIPSVDNEVAFADDIDGDGKAEYIYGDGGFVGYAKPGPDPTKMWTFHPVTEKGPWGAMYAHGLGTGDINGDGRKDIIQAYGWWEQPANPTSAPWTYHPERFGRWGPQQGGGGGARAYAYDVNGDGLNDVVTSLEAHGWGLAWFEQKKDAAGKISFVRHMIMDDLASPNNGVAFAALHAVALADVDGDGLQDIVTGKRWWGHFGENPSDPDAWGPPVVYWFKLVREGGQVRFVPELVNNNSAVGTDMIVVDLNKDGMADIMTATRRGTFVFLTQRPGGAPATTR